VAPVTKHTPEVATLLACARARASAEDDRRLAALIATGVDFPTLFALAVCHRLTAFVYAHLKRVAPDQVPSDVMEALQHSSHVSAARSLMLGAELVQLIELFTAHGIRALPFKGPVLAQCVYGDLALRFMKDVDILVAAKDVGRAHALLLSRGYRTQTKLLPGSVAWRLDYQLCLARAADTAIVELHWTVASLSVARELGIDQLWEQRLHTSVLGHRVPCPSHEHMLLVLCIHGARHAWWRLELICGVAELVRSKPLDWYRVLEEAAAWRCGRMLRVGLLLAHEVLGAPVPEFVLKIAQSDDHARELAQQSREDLFAPERSSLAAREPRRFQLRIQDGIVEKLRVLSYWPIMGSARKAAKLSAYIQQAAVG
jgi:putative nucleotidyltransferase-like protein